jgi:hypothetical protein
MEKQPKKQCKLCTSLQRTTIDAFLRTGATFKEFQARFEMKDCSIYTWSRHKHHVVAEEAAQNADIGDLLDLESLRRLNKKLLTLAVRSERSGKIVNAMQAYAAVSRNLELLERFKKPEPTDAAELPKTQEELSAAVREAFAALITGDSDFRRFALSLAMDTERETANLTTESRIAREQAYREHIRALLIEADAACAPQAPYYEVIPGEGEAR